MEELVISDTKLAAYIYILARTLVALFLVETGQAATERTDRPPIGNVTEDRVLSESASGTDWLVNGENFGSNHFSPLTSLNTTNVKDLGLAWFTDVDSPMGMPVEPLVADGVIFVPGTLDRVFAFDATTGKLKWRFDPQLRLAEMMFGSYAARINRGVALWEGKVFIGTGDCRVIALNATSGKLLWQSEVCDPHKTGITGAPRVGAGKVFVGFHGSETGTRGALVALDASTGRIAWRFWNVPGDPGKGFENSAMALAAKTWSGKNWWEAGGGNVWDPIVYDPKTRLVIYGTAGEGAGPTGTIDTSGARLFTNCIVALKADTGEYTWHYQTSPFAQKTFYSPENFHIAVADVSIKGVRRHVVMTVPRWAGFFMLDAVSGKLVSWKAMTDRGTAPKGEISLAGGNRTLAHNWWPMSYDGMTGLAYVGVYDYDSKRGPAYGRGDPTAFGRLVAWDPVKQAYKWSVDFPLAYNGGVLSTAGDLVFQGQGTGEFGAYAAEDGQKLWSFSTGSSIQSVPVSYRWQGQEYVLVAAGLGSGSALFAGTSQMATPSSRQGPSRLLAFRLGAQGVLPAPAPIVPVPEPPEQTASSSVIERGKGVLEKYSCWGCHGGPSLIGRGAWRLDGAIPDLRYMPREVHEQFQAIVLGGSRRPFGMPGFGDGHLNWPIMDQMTVDEANALHAYIIELQWQAYREDQKRLGHP